MLKNKGDIILTGDFNAKLEIKTAKYEQKISPNGKQLENLLEMNRMQAITIKEDCIKWTRQNRNLSDEKSIIDYVIATESISQHFNEILIDDKGTHRIKGKKESDHNTIMMEINTTVNNERKTIKRWKLNNTKGWEEFNNEIRKQCEQQQPKSQEELQNVIKNTLKHTVGQRTIKIGNNNNKETEEIKLLRQNKKLASKEYQRAIKYERESIPVKLEIYIEAQKKLKSELEKKRNI